MAILSSSGSASSFASEPPVWEQFDTGSLLWGEVSPEQGSGLVRHYAPKVKYLALRLKAKLPAHIELGDLISAGTLGLLEAFAKFRPALGVKFDTYAETRIRGAMLDELRSLDWVPRDLRRRVRALDEAMFKLEHSTGQPPTEESLCQATGLSLAEVREGLEALQNQFCLSLDLVLESLSGAESPREQEPYSRIASQELVDKVAALVVRLTEREKLVISLYYADELNMREVAEVMGITEGRVSQLHSQALGRLRKDFLLHYGEVLTL